MYSTFMSPADYWCVNINRIKKTPTALIFMYRVLAQYPIHSVITVLIFISFKCVIFPVLQMSLAVETNLQMTRGKNKQHLLCLHHRAVQKRKRKGMKWSFHSNIMNEWLAWKVFVVRTHKQNKRFKWFSLLAVSRGCWSKLLSRFDPTAAPAVIPATRATPPKSHPTR